MKSLALLCCGFFATLSGYELPAWWNIRTEATPPPPPFILCLGGLSNEEIAAFKTAPGVQEVRLKEDRYQIVWQPKRPGPWGNSSSGFIGKISEFHELLAIKSPLGKTQWRFTGRCLPQADTVIPGTYQSEITEIDFQDDKAGRGTLRITGHVEPPPGLLVHEMVRKMVGLPIQVIPIANANVIVCNTSDGIRVAWQISDQYYATIENSFDKDMVAAYIERLGCVTPKDFSIDFDQWMETELWWQFWMINRHFPRKSIDPDMQWLAIQGQRLYRWQEIEDNLGSILEKDPVEKKYEWIMRARPFLWANRANFKLAPNRHSFMLRGKDLYDPRRPPEFPAEIADPPKPELGLDGASANPGSKDDAGESKP